MCIDFFVMFKYKFISAVFSRVQWFPAFLNHEVIVQIIQMFYLLNSRLYFFLLLFILEDDVKAAFTHYGGGTVMLWDSFPYKGSGNLVEAYGATNSATADF